MGTFGFAEEQPVQKLDWKDVAGCLIVDIGMEQKSRQASIKDWTEKGKEEAKIIPEGRKEKSRKPPPLKRKRGKLSKKEQVEAERAWSTRSARG